MNPDIFPDEQQKQISEEMAIKIMKVICIDDEYIQYELSKIKKAGYIKESALDKAERLSKEFDDYLQKIKNVRGFEISALQNIVYFFKKAIAELQEKLNEKA